MLEHPLVVPVTVYVVVAVGLAVTLAVFVAFKPVDGLHEYVVAPLAVNTVLVPLQMVASVPASTVGTGESIIVSESVTAPQTFEAV